MRLGRIALNHVGGLLLKWYRDQFCAAEVAEAQRRQISAYRLLDAHLPEGISPVSPGSSTPPTCAPSG